MASTPTGDELGARFKAEAQKLKDDLRDVAKWYSYSRFDRWRRQAVHFISDWLRDGLEEIRALNEAANLQRDQGDPGAAISRCVRFLDDLVTDVVGKPAHAITGAGAVPGRPQLLKPSAAASPPPGIAPVIQRLDTFADNLERLVADGGDDARFERWREGVATFVAAAISENEARRFRSETQGIVNPYNQGYPGPDPQDAARTYLQNLKKDVLLNPSLAFNAAPAPDVADERLPGDRSRFPAAPLALLEQIAERFHLVARQLGSRREGRPTISVEDEYDLQDLLHALLRVHFQDVRAEEWTPSYAGKASRVDFLLKDEQIVVETKKTRQGLGAKEVGSQLIEDIARYQAHPACRALVCFVYDPEGLVTNPRGVE